MAFADYHGRHLGHKPLFALLNGTEQDVCHMQENDVCPDIFLNNADYHIVVHSATVIVALQTRKLEDHMKR